MLKGKGKGIKVGGKPGGALKGKRQKGTPVSGMLAVPTDPSGGLLGPFTSNPQPMVGNWPTELQHQVPPAEQQYQMRPVPMGWQPTVHSGIPEPTPMPRPGVYPAVSEPVSAYWEGYGEAGEEQYDFGEEEGNGEEDKQQLEEQDKGEEQQLKQDEEGTNKKEEDKEQEEGETEEGESNK